VVWASGVEDNGDGDDANTLAYISVTATRRVEPKLLMVRL